MNNNTKKLSLTNAKISIQNGEVYIAANYDKYKGDGKMWIANIPYEGAKFEFIKYEQYLPQTGYSGFKTFRLTDGVYLYHNFESKSNTFRCYFTVHNGEIIEGQHFDL